MTDQTSRCARTDRAQQDAAVELIAAAAQRVKNDDNSITRDELQTAVDHARSVGVGWTRIGDTLGIASGNAYQRHRKRTAPSAQADEARDPQH